MGKLIYLVLHSTATVAGNEVTSDQIRRWHMGLKDNKNGTYSYRGKLYKKLKDVPQEKFHGVFSLKTNGRGWGQVGYADMVHLNGEIENLVPYDEDDTVESNEITNGAFGVNSKARHIVYVGGQVKIGKAGDTRTDAQKEALKKYVLATIEKHPDIVVGGHGQFEGNKTACPAFDVPAWLLEIGVDEKNIKK